MEKLGCKDIISQISLTFHPNTKEHVFFSATHGAFESQTNHMLGYKARLSKDRKIKITAFTLSDYNETKLDF